MECPYCQNEMTPGKLEVDTTPAVPVRRFVAEGETPVKEKGMLGFMTRIKGNGDPEERFKAYRCDTCRKVFAEFNLE